MVSCNCGTSPNSNCATSERERETVSDQATQRPCRASKQKGERAHRASETSKGTRAEKTSNRFEAVPKVCIFDSKHRQVAVVANVQQLRQVLFRMALLADAHGGAERHGVRVGENALSGDDEARRRRRDLVPLLPRPVPRARAHL